MPMRDNVFLFQMQQTNLRAHPSGLPSNLILQQFVAPDETTTVTDTVTATSTAVAAMVYGGLVEFGSAADWQASTLSYTDATSRPGSVVLYNVGGVYSTDGTAQTAAIELLGGAALPAGTVVTFYFEDHNATSATADSLQVRFSSDGTTWGAWQAATNGAVLTNPLAYAQVLVTLTSTDNTRTGQVNCLRFSVETPARWDQAQYAYGVEIDTLMWLGMLPTAS